MRGCNITADRLCTSVSLAYKLLDRGITLVGTWQSNRKGFPEELKDVSGNELSAVICYLVDDTNKSVSNRNALRLCSYVTKRKSGKQNQVVLLTTTYPLKGITIDENVRKPVLLNLYDFTKGEQMPLISARPGESTPLKRKQTNGQWLDFSIYWAFRELSPRQFGH